MSRSTDVSSSYAAVAVTPSDATVIPITRALYIGGTGALTVRMAGGMNATFAAVAVGIFPVQVDKVLTTGTAATSIVAMY
jgi:hypothetical protein